MKGHLILIFMGVYVTRQQSSSQHLLTAMHCYPLTLQSIFIQTATSYANLLEQKKAFIQEKG